MSNSVKQYLQRTFRLALLASLVAPVALAGMPAEFSVANAAEQVGRIAVLPEVASVIQKGIDDKEVAGAVSLIVTNNGPVHLSAAGFADVQAKRAIKTDDIFWIASMSKPVTGVAVMMLVDQGKLSLDEPIGTYLPEMQDLKLADGTPVKVTLRHLMTHTSGMSELPGGAAYSSKNLAEASLKYAALPVQFEPGSKWQYSQTSINTAARIVEVVSGQTFDVFLAEHIFAPLGMKDTAFYLNDSQVQRLAKTYRRSDDGNLTEDAIWLLGGKSPADRDRMPAANGGLFSTAKDYGRFCQMLLRNGELDGKRILSAEAVRVFHTQAIGELTTGFTPGNTWGIGCCIVNQPQGATKSLSAGSYGHGGAFGTQAWIDPVKNRAFILMVQRSNFPNADASSLRAEFQSAGAASLDK